jgi:hypothetical protein
MFSRKICFQSYSPRVLGGQSIIYLENKQNGVQLGCTGRTVRGLPAGPRWTVRPAQRALLTAVDFTSLPLEFKRGQSARASRQSARYAFFT